MAKLEFKTLKFKDEANRIKVIFLKNYYFHIEKEALTKIEKHKLNTNSIEFPSISEKSANNKFMRLIDIGFTKLRNTLNNKKTLYIHQNSGIPLVGSGSFGIVDRGSNIIEIKPVTGCNLDCIYCSVNESNPNKTIDIVIEKDYLIQELIKVIKEKECNDIEVHIGVQGEPLLYAELIPLIEELSKINEIKRISMDTNAQLISKTIADKLIKAGLTRINISINSIDKELAKKMAGSNHYNINHSIELVKYLKNNPIKITIAPVWVPGINDNEISKIIKFAKENKVEIGIQNYLYYKNGRKPAKQKSWDEFYSELKEYEKEYKIKLILGPDDFKIKKCKQLKNPFKKDEILKLDIISPGRFINEKLAVSRGRVVSVINCKKDKGTVKAKIIRTKHNIIVATML